MGTFIRFGALALCAVVGVSASFGRPRQAADVTVSFAGLGFSWPEDARVFYSRLRRMADRICATMGLLRLADYATCGRRLSAALEAVQAAGASAWLLLLGEHQASRRGGDACEAVRAFADGAHAENKQQQHAAPSTAPDPRPDQLQIPTGHSAAAPCVDAPVRRAVHRARRASWSN
jgi:UrcA family protein